MNRTRGRGCCIKKKEEIEEVANQIDDGTYNQKDYRQSGTPDDLKTQNKKIENTGNAMHAPDIPERDYGDAIVSLIIGNLNTTLKSLTNDGGIPELKVSLRTLVTNLEDLHNNIKSPFTLS